METTARLKNGSTSSQHIWAYKTMTTQHYYKQQEAANAELTEAQLRGAATTIEDGERHVRLSTDLRYILINTTTGAAATVCRQYQHTIGFEMYRQLCIRFSIPLGTRSIGHFTRLLKPKFDNNNFEESFSTSEFELHNPYNNPIGYGNPFGGKGNKGYKGYNKGKGKGKNKGKQVTDTCYRCGTMPKTAE